MSLRNKNNSVNQLMVLTLTYFCRASSLACGAQRGPPAILHARTQHNARRAPNVSCHRAGTSQKGVRYRNYRHCCGVTSCWAFKSENSMQVAQSVIRNCGTAYDMPVDPNLPTAVPTPKGKVPTAQELEIIRRSQQGHNSYGPRGAKGLYLQRTAGFTQILNRFHMIENDDSLDDNYIHNINPAHLLLPGS